MERLGNPREKRVPLWRQQWPCKLTSSWVATALDTMQFPSNPYPTWVTIWPGCCPGLESFLSVTVRAPLESRLGAQGWNGSCDHGAVCMGWSHHGCHLEGPCPLLFRPLRALGGHAVPPCVGLSVDAPPGSAPAWPTAGLHTALLAAGSGAGSGDCALLALLLSCREPEFPEPIWHKAENGKRAALEKLQRVFL